MPDAACVRAPGSARAWRRPSGQVQPLCASSSDDVRTRRSRTGTGSAPRGARPQRARPRIRHRLSLLGASLKRSAQGDPSLRTGNGARPPLARSAASSSSSRKSGWAICGERLAALVDRLSLQLGGAVLGDDHVDLVPRRRDHRAGVEPGHDSGAQLARRPSPSRAGRAARGPRARERGRRRSPRGRRSRSAGAPLIVSATTWPWMSTATAPLIVTTLRLRGDQLGVVDELDGEEGDLVVSVEPLVELLVAGRRTSTTETSSKLPPFRFVTLPASWSFISPVGEHLGVDAVVAAVALGEQRRDHRRDCADPGLESRPVRRRRPRRSRRSPCRRLRPPSARAAGWAPRRSRRGRRSRRRGSRGGARAGALACAGSSARSRRRAGGRVGRGGPSHLADRGAGVEREAAPPLVVGRRRDRRHHARRLLLQQRLEAAEVGGGEADVRAGVAKRALERAVEAGEVVDVGVA